MNPNRVIRSEVHVLTDLPNIGPSLATDLRMVGIDVPTQLSGRDPYVMYEALCEVTQQRHDLCVLDVFISVTRFMNGEPPAVWWQFTEERKQTLAQRVRAPR